MVEHLPRIPGRKDRCLGCGKPSLTAFCDGCAPSSIGRPFGVEPEARGDADHQPVDYKTRRWNGRPLYRADPSRR
jgi:hypothetical protein